MRAKRNRPVINEANSEAFGDANTNGIAAHSDWLSSPAAPTAYSPELRDAFSGLPTLRSDRPEAGSGAHLDNTQITPANDSVACRYFRDMTVIEGVCND